MLAFYLEAGVDCALTDEPVNRLSDPDIDPGRPRGGAGPAGPDPPGRRRRDPGGARRPGGAGGRHPVGTGNGTNRAVTGGLRTLLEEFHGCALKDTATRLVFCDGNPKARIMFVGEAPGRDEDIEGLPFVGRSANCSTRMISAIGLDRSKAYIANGFNGGRPETAADAAGTQLPAVHSAADRTGQSGRAGDARHPSTQTPLSTREGMMKTRGKWFDYDTGTRSIRAIATFHPAYLLRSPSYKRMSWLDLRAIAKALEQTKAQPSS